MAKDDYYVVAYQILSYLYMCLKRGEKIETDKISHKSKYIDINFDYWVYIIEHLQRQGYIEGADVNRAWGGDMFISIENIQITPEGIGYLCDNSFIKKAKQFLKDIKEITPFV